LLAGAPDDVKEYYGLYAPENYSYLAGSKCYTVDGVDDKEEFEVSVYWSYAGIRTPTCGVVGLSIRTAADDGR
jgi:myosin heavy subunit